VAPNDLLSGFQMDVNGTAPFEVQCCVADNEGGAIGLGGTVTVP
jgi:hypothetical protein